MNNHDNECSWESGAFGLSEEHAKLADLHLEREVDDALELQMISIRLPRQLINDLKLIAPREGLGYQPLIRRVLQRFVEGEFRSMAHNNLSGPLCQSQHDVEPIESDMPRAACG